MRPLETLFTGMPWLGIALFQATAIATLGTLLWLAGRRWGPAARGALLLSTLLGVLAVPVLASVTPVWVPVPEPELPNIVAWSCPAASVYDAAAGLPGEGASPEAELPALPTKSEPVSKTAPTESASSAESTE